MTEELFSDLPLPDLEAIQTEDVRGKWPKTMAEMVDVAVAALKDQGDDAPRLARNVIAALAKYHGGRMWYLPCGKSLEQAIRDTRMWQEYSGRPEDIARFVLETGLTEQAVYRILAEQRKLHRDRIQSKLF